MDKFSFGENIDELPVVTELELEDSLDRWNQGEDSEEDTILLINYILNEFRSKGKTSFMTEDLAKRTGEIRAGFLFRKLSEKNLVDVLIDETGEDSFTLSEEGRKLHNQLYGD